MFRFIKKGLGSLLEPPTVAERRAESPATPVTKEEQARRIQEQMMDLDYLADVQNLSGIAMYEGPGSVFTALGYHGSPGSDEGQVNISHFKDRMGTSRGRMLGMYVPKEPFSKPVASMSQEDIDRMLASTHENFKFLGDPPSIGGIALDASTQIYGNDPPYPDKPRDGKDYADTLYHEARHRAFESESFQKLKDRLSKASVLSPDWKLRGDLLLAEKNQHAIYESIRQIQQGETTYDDLPKRDRALLDSFTNVEQALLDSFTERERLKLGLFEYKSTFKADSGEGPGMTKGQAPIRPGGSVSPGQTPSPPQKKGEGLQPAIDGLTERAIDKNPDTEIDDALRRQDALKIIEVLEMELEKGAILAPEIEEMLLLLLAQSPA